MVCTTILMAGENVRSRREFARLLRIWRKRCQIGAFWAAKPPHRSLTRVDMQHDMVSDRVAVVQ